MLIWEANDNSEYSNKVDLINYCHRGTSELNIQFMNGGKRKLVMINGGPWTAIDSNKIHPVSINILASKNSFSFRTSHSGAVRTFVAKEDFQISSLRDNSDDLAVNSGIWRAKNPKEYARKIMTDSIHPSIKATQIIIFHVNRKITHIGKFDGDWMEIAPSAILDLNEDRDRISFYFSKDPAKNTRIYTARGKFLFKQVQESTGTSCLDLWYTIDPKQYANKVVVKGSDTTEQYLAILFVNGLFKILHKSGNNQPWMDEKNISIQNLINMGLLPVDYEKPNFGDHKPQFQDSEPQLEKLEPVVYCDQASQVKAPEVQTLEIEELPVVSDLVSQDIPFVPPSTSTLPDLVQFSQGEISLELVLLEVTHTEDNQFYKVSFDGNKVTFCACQPYLFNLVKKGDEVLWEAKNYKFPNKIFVYVLEDDSLKIKYSVPNEVKEMVRNMSQPKSQSTESQAQAGRTRQKRKRQPKPKGTEMEEEETDLYHPNNLSQPRPGQPESDDEPTKTSQPRDEPIARPTRPKRSKRHKSQNIRPGSDAPETSVSPLPISRVRTVYF